MNNVRGDILWGDTLHYDTITVSIRCAYRRRDPVTLTGSDYTVTTTLVIKERNCWLIILLLLTDKN